MEDLALEDLVHHKPDLKETSLFGKAVFLQKLGFDQQKAIVDLTEELSESESIKVLLAVALRKRSGSQIFPNLDLNNLESFDQAREVLGKLEVDEIMTLFEKSNEQNGLDTETEAKNSEAAPST